MPIWNWPLLSGRRQSHQSWWSEKMSLNSHNNNYTRLTLTLSVTKTHLQHTLKLSMNLRSIPLIKLSSLRARKKKWRSREELDKNLKNIYIYKRKIRVWKFQKENEYIYIHTHCVNLKLVDLHYKNSIRVILLTF